MGLGDAIKRLTYIEWAGRIGGLTSEMRAERQMLLAALNHIPLHVGFDCDGDGVPDTIEIFEHAAATSCCRLRVPGESANPSTSRIDSTPPKKKPKGLFSFLGKSDEEES